MNHVSLIYVYILCSDDGDHLMPLAPPLVVFGFSAADAVFYGGGDGGGQLGGGWGAG
jgi:hypothetical protein